MEVDLIWTLVGFILTLLVFSYLFGDNPLFRLVTYLFVGVVAGYVFTVVIYQVIIPRLITPLTAGTSGERLLALVPLVLSGLLLTKLSPRLAAVGNLPVAFLTGASAAVVVGGAVTGTLVNQISATINLFDITAPTAEPGLRLLEGILTLVGAITTLAYFQFGAKLRADQSVRRPAIVEAAAAIGQVFIGITLGALFAGVFTSALSALIDRVGFIKDVLLSLF